MGPIPWRLIAGVLGSLAVLAAVVWWYDSQLDAARAEGVTAGRAEVQAKWDAAAARQREVDNKEEARRRAELKEITDAAQAQAALDRAAADRAAAAGDRLQRAYAAAIARCGNPGAAGRGAPGAAAGDLLADVQRRIDETAGELAAEADRRGAAGRACERSYDALNAGNEGRHSQ